LPTGTVEGICFTPRATKISVSPVDKLIKLKGLFYHFSRIADERLGGKEERISHEKAWE